MTYERESNVKHTTVTEKKTATEDKTIKTFLNLKIKTQM